jgi:hypothetical protein
MLAISDDDCNTVIAEYIRRKGVTRCPTACVVPTQASVTEADRVALEEYRSTRERQRREKAAARARSVLGGRRLLRMSAPIGAHSRAGSAAMHNAECMLDSCPINW